MLHNRIMTSTAPTSYATAPTASSSVLHFCKSCRYYLALEITDNTLTRICRNCGNKETVTGGALAHETVVQQAASEGHKILLNEFTASDPTLPHVSNIPCPNTNCPSKTGQVKQDVITIKSDPINLKYLYICTVCNQQWRSRT